MAEGYRVLDQVCPIISSDDSGPKKVGVLRLLVFLEDLGLAPGAVPEQPRRQSVPAPVATPAVQAAASPPPTKPSMPSPSQSLPATVPSKAAPPVLAPGPANAYELELWRRAEEDKFRAYLVEQEATLQERLEEEYRQKEEARAAEFHRRQAELRSVEAKVKKKLQELQQREVNLVAEEARVAALKDEVKRRTDLAVREHEDASRRKTADAQHGLGLARARGKHVEERVAKLEEELEAGHRRLSDLEAMHEERQRHLEAHMAPPENLRQELQNLRMQLKEQQLQAEALTASRDHFQGKVEELCGRLLGSSSSAPHASLHKRADQMLAWPEFQGGIQSDLSMGTGVAEALQKVQEDLAKLAQTWDSSPDIQRQTAAPQAPLSSDGDKPAMAPQLVPMRENGAPSEREKHLAWLQGQRADMLATGLYGSGDMVMMALDERIREAEQQVAKQKLQAMKIKI
eukprot:TRINITY_DN87339_c0_g1_i1.p1 TRINITY_DN87339_c0_g1~~TRINITY_DN87339_c0_g1_i1.p1  ORF type:complete len:507 (+),score=136.34 TRINITY_DN87339_c0_g1_i1:150-1523(+)